MTHEHRAGEPQDGGSATGGWDRPIPLGAAYRLPEFPMECFPTWLSDHGSAVAEATQTPPDLAGMLQLSALAACAGGRARLEIRAGWQEGLNLYTAVALPPGERKSAVFEAVISPLADFEAARATELGYEAAEGRARKKVAERALEAAQNAAARAMGAERERLLDQVAAAARELEDTVVPAEYRLLADDATPEALATLLAEQRGRMAVLSPEGGVFGLMAGRYSSNGGQPNLDLYLKGHNGDQLRVDRKGRPPEFVSQPALTLGLTLQPGLLQSLSEQPGFRGLGLLARFLFSLPPSRVGTRRADAPPVPVAIRQGYATTLRAMASSLDSLSPPKLLRLNLAAEAELVGFMAGLEPRLGEDGDLGHMSDWGCKLAGAVARIAGLLHLATSLRQGWDRPVTEKPMRAAIAIGHYLIPHAIVAFDLMEADPNLALARRVLRWIAINHKESFSMRDCYRAFASRLSRIEAIEPVLAILEHHGFVHRRLPERGGRGRPASPTFDVNPLLPEMS